MSAPPDTAADDLRADDAEGATPATAAPGETAEGAETAAAGADDAAAAPDADALPEVVYLDRIGTPGGTPSGPPATGSATVLVIGVPESARQRMLATGSFEVTEDRDRLADAHLVLISTRTPKGELSTLLAGLRGCPTPTVALAHTGGEALAVDVVRAGGRGVVAEGNERALLGYAFGEAVDTSLVETYDRQVARSRAGEDGGASHDPVTGLPGASTFTRRLTELGQTGDVPRIGFLQVLNLDRGGRSLSPQGLALLRRRLALQFRKLAGDADVELFAMTDIEFAILSPTLSPNKAEQLGHRMARVTEMFAPMGSRTLGLAVGHAGPEVSGELSMLRELAHRAMAVAATHESSGVVGADALALGASATIELEAAQRIIDAVELQSPRVPGHAKRTAAYAAAVAFELGYDGPECARVRLAAHLHEIGMAGADSAAFGPLAELDADALAVRRAAPDRGAAYARTSAGDEVAEIIRCHAERWDGSGFPQGLSQEQIPMGARIVALACRYDELTSGGRDGEPEGLDAETALARLGEEGGSALDPGLLVLAAPALARFSVDG